MAKKKKKTTTKLKKRKVPVKRKITQRAVYIFWHSKHDPEKNADIYNNCVINSTAVQNGCLVTSAKIDVLLQSNDPAMKHWSGAGTIEVAFVKDDTKVATLMNPGFFCKEIDRKVTELCR